MLHIEKRMETRKKTFKKESDVGMLLALVKKAWKQGGNTDEKSMETRWDDGSMETRWGYVDEFNSNPYISSHIG